LGKKWQEAGEDYIMGNFITCTLHQISLHVIRERSIRGAWYVARIGKMRNAYKILVGKPEGKELLRRPRSK
jgi:hypothetical protein